MSRAIDLDHVGIAVAGLLVAVALALLAVPGAESLLPGPIRALDALPADGVAALLALALAIVAGIGVIRRRPGRSATDAEESTPSDPRDDEGNRGAGSSDRHSGGRSDDATRTSTRVVGQRATERHERTIERLRSVSGCPEPEPPTRLRNVAIELEQHRGYDETEARERVEAGAWTTDPVAAAFLGGPEAGELSFRRRLYGAVYPARAYERRFERTMRALERVAAEAVEGNAGTDDPATTERERQGSERERGPEGATDGSADATEPAGSGGARDSGADGVA